MFTAYLYKSSDVENACKQFLNENFQETYVEDILDTLNCTEFVQDCLLKKEYLDGEIVEDDSHIRIGTSFSGSIKYINTDKFEQADLKCHFGSMKVYFDNAVLIMEED